MTTVYGFTESERRKFLEMYEFFRIMRPMRPQQGVDFDDYPSSDVYIAKTDEDGIDGLVLSSGVGTGSISNDRIHSAMCDLFRSIDDEETDDEADLFGMENTQKRVFNLSKEAVLGDAYVPIVRTKGGTWIAIGGSSAIRECVINAAATPVDNYYDATLLHLDHSATPPTVSFGVDIWLYDFMQITAATPTSLTIGKKYPCYATGQKKKDAEADDFGTGTIGSERPVYHAIGGWLASTECVDRSIRNTPH